MNTFRLLAIATVVAGAFEAAALAQGPVGGGGSGSTLPFTDIYKRPAVSPYTMLGSAPQQGNGGGGGSGQPNTQVGVSPLVYQQLIQPRLEQERQQTQIIKQNRQLGSLQNQVQSIQRDTRQRQINETIRPTGHSSTHMNMSHYYGGQRGR